MYDVSDISGCWTDPAPNDMLLHYSRRSPLPYQLRSRPRTVGNEVQVYHIGSDKDELESVDEENWFFSEVAANGGVSVEAGATAVALVSTGDAPGDVLSADIPYGSRYKDLQDAIDDMVYSLRSLESVDQISLEQVALPPYDVPKVATDEQIDVQSRLAPKHVFESTLLFDEFIVFFERLDAFDSNLADIVFRVTNILDCLRLFALYANSRCPMGLEPLEGILADRWWMYRSDQSAY